MEPAQTPWFRVLFQKRLFLLQPQLGPECVLHGLSRAAGCWVINYHQVLEPTVPDGLVSEAIQGFLPRAFTTQCWSGRRPTRRRSAPRPRPWGLEESDMTEQDSNHGPGEDFAPLYPDHVYGWGNPGMRGVTAARVEARTNDLVFQEYPGTISVILRGFPAPERVLRED